MFTSPVGSLSNCRYSYSLDEFVSIWAISTDGERSLGFSATRQEYTAVDELLLFVFFLYYFFIILLIIFIVVVVVVMMSIICCYFNYTQYNY